jgi:hypothetical protein
LGVFQESAYKKPHTHIIRTETKYSVQPYIRNVSKETIHQAAPNTRNGKTSTTASGGHFQHIITLLCFFDFTVIFLFFFLGGGGKTNPFHKMGCVTFQLLCVCHPIA